MKWQEKEWDGLMQRMTPAADVRVIATIEQTTINERWEKKR